MEPSSERNPFDLPARRDLDRIEAHSQQNAEKLGTPKILFPEEVRSSLADVFLRMSDPTAFRNLVEVRRTKWEESWTTLVRLNPAQIEFSIDYHAVTIGLKSDGPSGQTYGSPLSSDLVGVTVKGYPVLMELSKHPDQFFLGFSLTTAKQVLKCIPLIAKEYSEEFSFELGKKAQAAEKSGEPQIIDRLLIVSDRTKIESSAQFLDLCKVFLASKVPAQFSREVICTAFDSEMARLQKLQGHSLLYRMADAALLGVGYVVFKVAEYLSERRVRRAFAEAGESFDRALKKNQQELADAVPVCGLVAPSLLSNLIKIDPVNTEQRKSYAISLERE